METAETKGKPLGPAAFSKTSFDKWDIRFCPHHQKPMVMSELDNLVCISRIAFSCLMRGGHHNVGQYIRRGIRDIRGVRQWALSALF